MKMMINILLIGFIAWLTTGCPSSTNSLSFQNVTKNKVYFEIEGVQLYSDDKGPRDFSGWCYPNQAYSYSVLGPIRLTYPIKISWKLEDNGKKEICEYNEILGIKNRTKVVDESGVLVVGINTNYKCQVFYIKGDVIKTALYQDILRGKTNLTDVIR